MIIEIALGIVLAVFILALLPVLFQGALLLGAWIVAAVVTFGVIGLVLFLLASGNDWAALNHPVAYQFFWQLVGNLIIAAILFFSGRWVVSEIRRYRKMYAEWKVSRNRGEA